MPEGTNSQQMMPLFVKKDKYIAFLLHSGPAVPFFLVLVAAGFSTFVLSLNCGHNPNIIAHDDSGDES